MNIIFDVIGTPSEEDLSFVTDPKAIEYLTSFNKRSRKELSVMFPGVGEEALDFLNKMLVFNPFLRPSIDECLDHPYLDKIKHYFKLL